MPPSAREPASGAARFGTFGGVFTPCVLTILGVIMFLRFGEVVGNAGVLQAVGIVLAAKLITILTAFSLSAIATNTRTRGGGAYFLISRSLGVEFGGTIGLVFFLAQAISVAMYVIGFSEALLDTFPALIEVPGVSLVTVASVVNAVVFACVYVGAGWTIRVQYVILAVLVLSLISFGAGAAREWSVPLLESNVAPSYRDGESLVTMFALFFPAVTGIMAGANMSGDLRDPGRSIPLGTIAAVLVTAATYLVLAVLLAAVADRDRLLSDRLVMEHVAVVPWLVAAGVFAATLSSALGSMMGSPRILQAFARDQVLPVLRPFAAGSGGTGEPRRAVIATFVIAQGGVLLGDLNAIAPVITMAFMITYGTLNFATFLESFTGNPSYRPRFRLNHWSFSALGTLLCGVVMFLISWEWALLSIVGMLLLHRIIAQREIRASWGDLRSGLAFERARRNLAVLEEELDHPKNWRPILLTCKGAGDRRRHLAVFGHWLTAGHGLQSLGLVIEGDIEELIDRRAAQRDVLRGFMRDERLTAFPAVTVADSIEDGVVSLVQCHGLGGLEPNTVMFGWPSSPEHAERFGRLLRTVAALQRSVLVVRSRAEDESVDSAPSGFVDVWWRGRDNGPLMVLLAHLLTRNEGWRGRTVRLMRVVPNEAARPEVIRHLTALVESARIPAMPRCVVDEDPVAAIRRESAASAMVILGFEPPEPGAEAAWLEAMGRLSGAFPRCILVDSAGGMALES